MYMRAFCVVAILGGRILITYTTVNKNVNTKSSTPPIEGRLRTVSWSNYSCLTGVVNQFTGPTSIHAIVVQLQGLHSISSKLALLRRIKRYLPIEYRKLFYNAYILPSLDYCLTIWGNTSKTQVERLHKLQKGAARIILDAAPDAPSQPLFTELNWLIFMNV